MIRLASLGVAALLLAGCVGDVQTKATATASVQAPVTASLFSFGQPMSQTDSPVMMERGCAPPPAYLRRSAPLPRVTLRTMTVRQLALHAIALAGQYRALARAHDPLVDWINANCR